MSAIADWDDVMERFLARCYDEDGAFLDIGANIGLINSLPFANIIDPSNLKALPLRVTQLRGSDALGGDACGVERAADALHCAWIDAKALGNLPNALSAPRCL